MEVVSINNYAGFSRRFWAFVIDRICIWFILYVIWGYSRDFHMYNVKSLFSLDTLWLELMMMAYFVICETSSWQGTLGKHLLGMKVVTEKYQKLTVADAILRYLSKYLSTFVFLLGYIWIMFDPKKQGWHDKLAGTYVILS